MPGVSKHTKTIESPITVQKVLIATPYNNPSNSNTVSVLQSSQVLYVSEGVRVR